MDSSFSSNSTFSFDPDAFTVTENECNKEFLIFKAYVLEVHTPELVRVLLEEERSTHYSITIEVKTL